MASLRARSPPELVAYGAPVEASDERYADHLHSAGFRRSGNHGVAPFRDLLRVSLGVAVVFAIASIKYPGLSTKAVVAQTDDGLAYLVVLCDFTSISSNRPDTTSAAKSLHWLYRAGSGSAGSAESAQSGDPTKHYY